MGEHPDSKDFDDGKPLSSVKRLKKELGETGTPTWELSPQRAGLATGALNRHGAPPNIDAPFRNASDPISSPEKVVLQAECQTPSRMGQDFGLREVFVVIHPSPDDVMNNARGRYRGLLVR